MRSLLDQHAAMARTLDDLGPLLSAPSPGAAERESLAELSNRYAWNLLAHIDAESSVLLPESETRLLRAGVAELASRGPDPEERAALVDSDRLASLYPPVEDAGAIREGCVICPSYGVTCEGLEREWWTDQEWDDFREREG